MAESTRGPSWQGQFWTLLDRAGCTQQGVEHTVYSMKDPSPGCDVTHNQGETFLQLNFPENSLTDTPRGLRLLGNSKASKVDNEDWPSQGQINPSCKGLSMRYTTKNHIPGLCSPAATYSHPATAAIRSVPRHCQSFPAGQMITSS